MIGYVALLAALECVHPMAPATAVSTRPALRRTEAKKDTQRKASESGQADFQMTATSQVLLNGHPCRFEDVPDGAVITKIVVNEFTQAVVTVHFRADQ